MTIIKVSRDGKAIIKKKEDETVLPLAPENTEVPVRAVQVRVTPTVRSKRCFNVFLLVVALAVLAAGIIGGVYLFKYMVHKTKKCHVTVQYEQQEYEDYVKDYVDTQPERLPTPVAQSGYYLMEEDIDIFEDEETERIEVPRFDECRRSVVIHDFRMNLTVIVDNDDKECFLMDLDRDHISPPRSFAELIRRYNAGYYMPKVDVIRRDFEVVTPALTDLRFAGTSIMLECEAFDTYRLRKRDIITPIHFKLMKAYGYSDLKSLLKDHVIRF